MSENTTASAVPVSPRDAAEWWAQVGQYLDRVAGQVERMLPADPEGMRGLGEQTRQEITEAVEQALLAADTAAGTYGRLAAAAGGQRGETVPAYGQAPVSYPAAR